MRWLGEKEFVIGETDEAGNVVKEFRVQPGEEIPVEAFKLIKDAGTDLLEVPYYDDGYNRELVKKAALKAEAVDEQRKGE